MTGLGKGRTHEVVQPLLSVSFLSSHFQPSRLAIQALSSPNQGLQAGEGYVKHGSSENLSQ